MHNPKLYKDQIDRTLSPSQFCNLIDEYMRLNQKYGTGGMIIISGGDPLLRSSFYSILGHIKEYYTEHCFLAVLGNSYLIDNDTVKREYIYR